MPTSVGKPGSLDHVELVVKMKSVQTRQNEVLANCLHYPLHLSGDTDARPPPTVCCLVGCNAWPTLILHMST